MKIAVNQLDFSWLTTENTLEVSRAERKGVRTWLGTGRPTVLSAQAFNGVGGVGPAGGGEVSNALIGGRSGFAMTCRVGR